MAHRNETQRNLAEMAERMKRRDRRGPLRKSKMGTTQGLCDSTLFTEVFGLERARETRRTIPLRTLRFIAGKGIEDVISGTCKQTGRSAEKTLNGVCPARVELRTQESGKS